ncbi:MAG: DNA-3-methyladenine glycosylase I [Pseudomonadota bacterium]
MRSFDAIHAIAAERHADLDERIAAGGPSFPADSDDRWLAGFTKAVFSAGFNWRVIEAKWDGFEAAFWGFDVGRCAMMSEEDLDSLVADTRIVRNGAKIQSVRDNAVMLQELASTHGSATKAIAGWPDKDFIGLLSHLKRHGGRLGGTTAQYALRFGGKSSFILSADVVARLQAEGVIDKAPTSQKALVAVQTAFDTWQTQSGRSLTEISRVLALSIG